MKTSLFDYELPRKLIAQRPAEARDASRLMVCDKETGAAEDRVFSDFPDLLDPGDVLVINDSLVYPARLLGERETGGFTEIMLLRDLGDGKFRALVRPGKKLGVGARVSFPGSEMTAEVSAMLERGERVVELFGVTDVKAEIDAIGAVPLPPYIHRDGPPDEHDRKRYQTVYARRRGAVAAPTAGLHFTEQLLDDIKSKGAEVVEITLHVSYGTFKPMMTETLEEHELETEEVNISRSSARVISGAKLERRRVIAVGTTVVRALETAAAADVVAPYRGETDLFIYPGYKFRAVDALLTNFHLPKSSLLALVCAFAGTNKVLGWYERAVEKGYRFYSYGDAMFVR
jgi:S-adenosylmethionine:tRNA ribosyltransferase-isomerase